MHTIQRKAVIYTTLGIVGYLLLWEYSCFISGTENNIEITSKPFITEYSQREARSKQAIALLQTAHCVDPENIHPTPRKGFSL